MLCSENVPAMALELAAGEPPLAAPPCEQPRPPSFPDFADAVTAWMWRLALP